MKGRLKEEGCNVDYIYVSEKTNSYAIAYKVLCYGITIFIAFLGQGSVLL